MSRSRQSSENSERLARLEAEDRGVAYLEKSPPHVAFATALTAEAFLAEKWSVEQSKMMERGETVREPMRGLTNLASQAASRLNLIRGRDNRWRGRCPACGYAKPTLEVAVEQDGIAVSCTACGAVGGIAAMMGIPSELVVAPRAQPSKVARALDAWRNSTPATGTLVESYLQSR